MIDKFVMLEFLAAREDAQPGVHPSGSTLFADAAHLEPQQSLIMKSVTRVLAELRRLEWVDWGWYSPPSGAHEPAARHLTDTDIQNVHEIGLSRHGYEALDRRRAQATTQINFINSPIGRLALRDINNLDLSTVLVAAEQQLEAIEAPVEE